MKRFLSAFLTMAMLITALAISTPVKAVGEVTFTVGSVVAETGEFIDVPITLSDNPGIAILQFKITLGQGLEWDRDITDYVNTNASTWPFTLSNDVLPGTAPSPTNITADSITLMFLGLGSNSYTDGTLATLKLKVKGDAPSGDVSLAMDIIGCYDESYTSVAYNNPVAPGQVTVKAPLTGTASISNTLPKIGIPCDRRFCFAGR